MTIKSNALRARQNLLVAALNTALARRLITLECEPVEEAIFEFALDGHPVIAYIKDAGYDEVTVHVTCRPTDLGLKFKNSIMSEWRRFGEAVAHGWLERRTGKYLQSPSSGRDNYHGTKQLTPMLAALMVEPHGFDAKGKFRF
jgi:hypothetical protein